MNCKEQWRVISLAMLGFETSGLLAAKKAPHCSDARPMLFCGESLALFRLPQLWDTEAVRQRERIDVAFNNFERINFGNCLKFLFPVKYYQVNTQLALRLLPVGASRCPLLPVFVKMLG